MVKHLVTALDKSVSLHCNRALLFFFVPAIDTVLNSVASTQNFDALRRLVSATSVVFKKQQQLNTFS